MNKFEDILQKAKQISLSPQEKQHIRAELELFMRLHPQKAKQDVFVLKPFFARFQFAPLAAALVLLCIGGTSFAAEGALPGDFLYPVKVGINEELQGFLIFSSEEKAEWKATLAERRLHEAEKLALAGRLGAKESAQIEKKLEHHVKGFRAQAGKKKSNTSIEIQSNFEASLRAHEQILSHIETKQEKQKIGIDSLRSQLRTHAEESDKARTETQEQVFLEEEVNPRQASEGKLGAAEQKIEEVERFLARKQVSESTRIETQDKLLLAREAIARGRAALDAEIFGKAFANFQEGLRLAQEAKLFAELKEKLQLNGGFLPKLELPNVLP